MTGIEILAAKEVVAAYEFSWVIYVGIIIVAAILSAAVGYCCSEPRPTIQNAIVGLIIGGLFGAIIGLAPASCIIPCEYETQYKVIISDEVSMNEFLEKYEIVNTEGKIYTVRERNE